MRKIMLTISKCKIKNNKVIIKNTSNVTNTQLLDLSVFTSISKSEDFVYSKHFTQLNTLFKNFSLLSVDANNNIYVIHTN